ncbi:MAG: tryptophan 2-C-methyltransferase, partial [Proteobacteria bacterium]|nr:tryptophan 2-C-methyltransferase [Pseudomonadota bacterium]
MTSGADQPPTSKALVTLINPNKVHPGITPYALDILSSSLEDAGFEVHVLDLTFERDHWRRVVRDYFAIHDPLLIGVSIRNTDTIYPQEQRCFLHDHLEIITEIKAACRAPIIAGGVGFSSMPFALAEYFEVQFGVKGPGEVIICEVADRLHRGQPLDTVPGLILVNHGRAWQVPDGPVPHRDRAFSIHRLGPYRRRSGHALRVDNLRYYVRGGLGNILTKNGCSFGCTHCVEPDAKGAIFARRDIASVVDELEALTAQGVLDVHSSDSEFNLSIGNTKRILREIVARKGRDRTSPLHELRLWVYCQPLPFDAEFAELLAEAGCRGVNLSADHVR